MNDAFSINFYRSNRYIVLIVDFCQFMMKSALSVYGHMLDGKLLYNKNVAI